MLMARENLDDARDLHSSQALVSCAVINVQCQLFFMYPPRVVSGLNPSSKQAEAAAASGRTHQGTTIMRPDSAA